MFQTNLLTFQEECLKGITILVSEQSWETVTSGMIRVELNLPLSLLCIILRRPYLFNPDRPDYEAVERPSHLMVIFFLHRYLWGWLPYNGRMSWRGRYSN